MRTFWVNIVYIWGTNSIPELYSRVWCNVVHWKLTDFSEKHIASIFRIVEETKQLCFLAASLWFLLWIILPPRKWRQCIPPKCQLTFNGLGQLGTCFTLVSCLVYSSSVKMEAKCSSETSVDFQGTTRRYIPEDDTLHNHRCENLRSYIFISSVRMKNVLQRKIWYRYKSTDLPCVMCSTSSGCGRRRLPARVETSSEYIE
jgi:hypothetical protein